MIACLVGDKDRTASFSSCVLYVILLREHDDDLASLSMVGPTITPMILTAFAIKATLADIGSRSPWR
jgi:hypothetical protein